jgi:hypothetical protein
LQTPPRRRQGAGTDGGCSLCEELKSAHSVEELRPSLRALVDAVEMSTAKSVFREVANEERRAKLAATFAQVDSSPPSALD